LLDGNKSCCDTPLGTIEFLKDAKTILSEKFQLSRVDEVFTHTRKYVFKNNCLFSIINDYFGPIRFTILFSMDDLLFITSDIRTIATFKRSKKWYIHSKKWFPDVLC